MKNNCYSIAMVCGLLKRHTNNASNGNVLLLEHLICYPIPFALLNKMPLYIVWWWLSYDFYVYQWTKSPLSIRLIYELSNHIHIQANYIKITWIYEIKYALSPSLSYAHTITRIVCFILCFLLSLAPIVFVYFIILFSNCVMRVIIWCGLSFIVIHG